MNEETQKRIEQLTALGFRLECGPPSGQVDESGEKAWPHIAYTVTLYHGEKKILATDYRLGVGHVDIKKGHPRSMILTGEQSGFLSSWQSRPHADFKNKQLKAEVAAKLARAQKVAPTLDCVLHSLLMDGDAYFSGERFEDWADNCGYSTDSRKAEEIFKACDLIGRQLNKVPRAILDRVREITQDM